MALEVYYPCRLFVAVSGAVVVLFELSTMHNQSKRVRDMREAHDTRTPLAMENDRFGGSASKAGVKDLPFSTSAADDRDEEVLRANSDLLNTWMQRLQTLTVVTAFLASIDGQLFSLTTLNTQIGLPTGTSSRELVYSCLAGALIFHICAGILGYVASFALIRYRIVETIGDDDQKVRSIMSYGLVPTQPAQRPTRKIVLEAVRPLHGLTSFLQRPERFRFLAMFRSSQPSEEPPLSLLTHCYYTTLCLSAAGFMLAVTGILAFIWVALPVPVRIFSTVCLGIGVSAGLWSVAL